MRLRPTKGISIEWQELFVIVVACTLWFPHFSGKRIQFWCNNELVVAIINSGHSKTPCMMDLPRFLVLLSMKHNSFVRAHHVPGVSNDITDSLSCFQDERFRQWLPRHKKTRTILPSLMTLWQKRFRRTQSGDWQDYQPCLWVRWNMFYSVLPFTQAYDAGGWHSPSFGRNIDVFCLINLARTVKHGTVKLYLAAVCNLHSSCGP